MTDADLHLLTAAYSVDALDPDELLAFEAHLATCEACQHEVRELRRTAALLGSVSDEVPPQTLRTRILDQVHVTAQDRPAVEATEALPTPSRSPRRATTWLAVAAAVLAVALVGIGTWTISVDRTNARLAAQAEHVRAVLTAPDASVSSQPLPGGGRGTVVASSAQRISIFLGGGLAIPPSNKTYELWYIDNAGKATAAGIFVPNSDGSAVARLSGLAPAATHLVGLTVEPAGGSTQPTTKPIMLVRVKA